MTLKHAFSILGLAIAGAACSPTTPCPGTECEPIGWFTGHQTCNCVAAAAVPPPPPPVAPPPPRSPLRGG